MPSAYPSSLAALSWDLLAAATWWPLRQLLVMAALAASAFAAGFALLGWLGPAGLPGPRDRPCRGAAAAGGPGPRAAAGDGPGPRATAGSGPGPAPGEILDTVALATTLGLVALAEVGWLLGMVGLLRPLPVALALLAVHAAGFRAWRWPGTAGRGLGRWLGEAGFRRRRLALLTGGAVGLLPLALLTLYPPVAFDETLYHLPFARAFAESGSLPLLPFLRASVFPQLQETLFAMVLPYGGDLAPHAVSLLATLLTAALLLAWGRHLSPGAGWIAAAAWAGTPLVVYLAGTAYVEPGLAMLVTASLYAAWRWREGAQGAARGQAEGAAGADTREGWLTLAALLAGGAAASKYLGLFFVGLVALAAVTAGPGARPAWRWRRLTRVVVAASLVMAPWYGRIVAVTGNPVFPFLPGVFGSSAWDPAGYDAETLRRSVRELPATLVRLPWDAVLARQRLGGLPPYSPVFLLALPALLAAAATRRRVRSLLLPAAAFALPVAALSHDARYLSAVLPVASLAVGESLAAPLGAWARRHGRDERWVRGRAAAVALAIVLPGWLYAGYRLARLGPPPVTSKGRDAFLARALPAYPAIRHLNRACGSRSTLYAIHAENMTYFAAGRFVGDWSGPGAYARVLPGNGDARLLFQRLRSLGVDHLLVLEHDQALPAFTADFDRFFRPVYDDGQARLYALRGCGCGALDPGAQ